VLFQPPREDSADAEIIAPLRLPPSSLVSDVGSTCVKIARSRALVSALTNQASDKTVSVVCARAARDSASPANWALPLLTR